MPSAGHPPLPFQVYERLFDHASEPFLLAAGDGTILRANPAACRMLGLDEPGLRRAGLGGILEEGSLLADGAAGPDAPGVAGHASLRRADGTVLPVAFSSRTVPGNRAGPVTLIALRDVSERRRQDEDLRESEATFRVAFRTSPDSVNLNRLDGSFVEVNDGFCRLTGWTAEEVAGESSLSIGLWADPADRERLVAGLQRHGVVENLEAPFRRKDGSVGVGLMSARLFTLHGETLILSMTRDITELRRAEAEREQLRHGLERSARMEAIGQLAGGVAHDFNNMLTVILSCVESLREDAALGRPAQAEEVDEIRAAAHRAHDLTRQLLAFARRQVIQPVPLDLNEVLQASEKLLRRVLGEDVALVVEPGQGLWPVLCDRGQMEQVVVNLAVNARDAMAGGGTLFLSTGNLEVRDAPLRPGPHVALTVRDTGAGLSPEARAHLFEPFFTTKAKGRGTGLGLATVYGIVKQSGGDVQVESEPGRGTTFQILLPRSREAAAVEASSRAPSVARGSETVLVVEDEPGVREVTTRALRQSGYEVLSARSGEEAIGLPQSTLGRVRLLVTDVVMPGMDGRATSEALRRLHPDLRVLFVSGYTEDAIVRHGVIEGGIQFLSKPFTPADLVARVRLLLDAPAATLARPGPAADAWPAGLATGIAEVDEQHRELLAHLAELEEAARDGALARATELLAYLERYATEHFAAEERLMRERGFPDADRHAGRHRLFVAELVRRREAYRANPSRAALLEELARWMERWLADHVLDEDVAMARHVREAEAARPTAAPERRP